MYSTSVDVRRTRTGGHTTRWKKGVSEWRTLAVDCSMEKFTKNRASDAKYARAVPLDGEKVYKV